MSWSSTLLCTFSTIIKELKVIKIFIYECPISINALAQQKIVARCPGKSKQISKLDPSDQAFDIRT